MAGAVFVIGACPRLAGLCLHSRCLFFADEKEDTVLGSLPLLSFRVGGVESSDNVTRKFAFKVSKTCLFLVLCSQAATRARLLWNAAGVCTAVYAMTAHLWGFEEVCRFTWGCLVDSGWLIAADWQIALLMTEESTVGVEASVQKMRGILLTFTWNYNNLKNKWCMCFHWKVTLKLKIDISY